ncbi:MAG: hypothetical protein Q4D64_00270 [Prevotellaceae bacterium]|nr:hypothetical protein [Prevotellaceae bacterium]
MKKIIAIIEKGKDGGYSIYAADDLIQHKFDDMISRLSDVKF